MLSFIIFLIIIYILFVIYYNYIHNSIIPPNENLDLDVNEKKISTYKLKNNINKNYKDRFNIKNFDHINNNVMILNQHKNELLEYKQQKENIFLEIEKKNKQKKDLLIKNIKENTDKNLILELNKSINNIKNEITSLSLSLKSDINNILNDIKNKKISLSEKNELKNNLYKYLQDINKELYKYKNIDTNINNKYSEEYKNLVKLYITFLNKKFQILSKKSNIYNKIL